jgi:hypothetical protein
MMIGMGHTIHPNASEQLQWGDMRERKERNKEIIK